MTIFRDTEWDFTKEVEPRYKIRSVDPEKPFINKHTNALDSDQGMHQDCSFMGALCAFAHYRDDDDKWAQFRLAKDKLHQRVLGIQHNTTEARKTRKFIFEFYAFKQWQTIEIDDRLHMWSVQPYDKPALADEPRTGVYWACFLEKAYAKLHGNYKNICEGWTAEAFADLTGGLIVTNNLGINAETVAAFDAKIKPHFESLFDFLAHYITRAMICSASTTGLDEDSRDPTNEDHWRNVGLVPSHCYCLMRVERVQLLNGSHVELLQFHNPHGVNYSGRPCAEWIGDYSDACEKWNGVSEAEKKRIGFIAQNEGTFWMPYSEWPNYMFDLTICLLPSMCPDTGRFVGHDHFLREVGGTFTVRNAPLQLERKWYETDLRQKVDFTLNIDKMTGKTGTRPVYLQLLVDTPSRQTKYFYQMNVYDCRETRIDPIMPLSRNLVRNRVTERATGEHVELYRMGGHLYMLQPGTYTGTIYFGRRTQKLDFKIRTMGDGIKLSM